MSTADQKYMARCIQLAKNGLGTTYPNPLVGSIIVHNDEIIGEGWHQASGKPHAEVNAVNAVKNQSLLPECTIYVSLEPCSHFGKTPPCSDLIISKGIKRVVVGTIDPFSKVAGTGIQKLIAAGCNVTVGILETECQELNKRFFTYHNQQRPYIILKWAETVDGYIAPEYKDQRAPVWITNTYARQLVHKWRAEEQAILVGNRTVIEDNPKLTIRDWIGNNPIRIVLDPSNKIPEGSSVLDQKVTSIIITDSTNKKNKKHIIYEKIAPKTNCIQQICNILYYHQLQSVIIEGGAKTIQSFIEADMWDEARVFKRATTFSAGTKAPTIKSNTFSIQYILDNTLITYKNDKNTIV